MVIVFALHIKILNNRILLLQQESIFVMKCGGMRVTREKYGVDGGVRVEEVLQFEEKTEEQVVRYTKMLKEI